MKKISFKIFISALSLGWIFPLYLSIGTPPFLTPVDPAIAMAIESYEVVSKGKIFVKTFPYDYDLFVIGGAWLALICLCWSSFLVWKLVIKKDKLNEIFE